MTDALAVLAASWGVLMALSPTLQVRRMLARRSSADVSIAYLAVLQIGFGLWVGYGLAIANWALVIPNAVAFLIGVLTIGLPAAMYSRVLVGLMNRVASLRANGCRQTSQPAMKRGSSS